MNKKIFSIVPVIFVLSLLYVLSVNHTDENGLANTLLFSAVYHDDSHIVIISYLDKSNHTNSAILEVEGLNQSYQKKYFQSSFVDKINIASIPQYGWKTTPVTLEIDHKEFGRVILKTEITPYGEQSSKVIYSRP
jgi:hypothetical protein